jgi:hypothetical protein
VFHNLDFETVTQMKAIGTAAAAAAAAAAAQSSAANFTESDLN